MRAVSFACFLIAAFNPLFSQSRRPGGTSAAKALHALFDAEWDYQMEQEPTHASHLGDRRWNDRWPDRSLRAIAGRQQHNLEVLKRLEAVPRGRLSPSDRLNYDLFRRTYEDEIEEYKYRWYLVTLNQRGGIQTADEIGDSLRFQTVKDFEDWIGRLRDFSEYLDQTIALMREGIHAHMLLPKVIMERVPAQIEKQIVSSPEQSPFYKPFTRPAAVTQPERDRLLKAAGDAIASSVIPSFVKLKEFFVKEYLPACPEPVGAWQMPNGEPMYAFFARKYTTTSLTPKEIHEIGLREVARIRAGMDALIKQMDFKGSFARFLEFLRNEPRFYYKTPEELLDAYRAMSKRIDPNLVKVFRTLPRMPYGVDPVPEIIAPDTTTAYYHEPAADGSRPGTYFVNLYKPETRPKYEMMALSLHESVPGHHLQIALAMELGEIPKFRRYGGYTAFVEGWGLYAESLGEDMGLYDDPYSKFGQLTYEMWRAVRLVVDTGMHVMRWDRKKAIDFFMENAAKQELDVVNEIDRYIAWPGQALAYKIGELKIKELRARARQRLGDRFDVKAFHEAVLGSGAVPLDILEQNIEAWLQKEKR